MAQTLGELRPLPAPALCLQPAQVQMYGSAVRMSVVTRSVLCENEVAHSALPYEVPHLKTAIAVALNQVQSKDRSADQALSIRG